MNKELLGEKLTFQLRNLFNQTTFDAGLLINPDRLQVKSFLDGWGRQTIRLLLPIATKEDQVFDYPADWWQAFKERWFPQWLLKRYPVTRNRVWAIHKFPELNVPNEYVGREFVHFRVIRDEELMDNEEKKESAEVAP